MRMHFCFASINMLHHNRAFSLNLGISIYFMEKTAKKKNDLVRVPCLKQGTQLNYLLNPYTVLHKFRGSDGI